VVTVYLTPEPPGPDSEPAGDAESSVGVTELKFQVHCRARLQRALRVRLDSELLLDPAVENPSCARSEGSLLAQEVKVSRESDNDVQVTSAGRGCNILTTWLALRFLLPLTGGSVLMFIKSLLRVAVAVAKEGSGDDLVEMFLEMAIRLKDEGRTGEAAAVEFFNQVTLMATTEETKRTQVSVAYFHLGNIFRARHSYYEAHVCFERASKLNPEYPEAAFNHSMCLLLMGEVDTAITSQLRSVANLPPGSPDVESQRRMLAALNYSDTLPRDEVFHRQNDRANRQDDFELPFGHIFFMQGCE
jgi:tetratricopeptide (TPR) repeat protein